MNRRTENLKKNRPRIEISQQQAEALQVRLKKQALTEEDLRFVSVLLEWYLWLVGKVHRMRKLEWLKEALGLSGRGSEAEDKPQDFSQTNSRKEEPPPSVPSKPESPPESSEERKGGNPLGQGHGRRKGEDYPGLKRVSCPHPELRVGGRCPLCDGKLFERSQPKIELRFTGSPPVSGIRYELQQLECSSCRRVFTAPMPPEASPRKYDEQVRAILGILTYTQGFPALRIAALQRAFGIPLAATTQWGLICEMITEMDPVYEVLWKFGTQGGLFYQDDTGVKIMELMRQNKTLDPAKDRTGMHTTALVILTKVEGVERKIVLYFSSRLHAGENLDQLLKARPPELPVPLQMSDASSRNHKLSSETLALFCNTHALRNFKENTREAFPEETQKILQVFQRIYQVDEVCRELDFNDAQRLRLHQLISGPRMEALKQEMLQHFEKREVEPNSSLGRAMNYMLKRWEGLTGFLRIPGAPLDSNEVERALKVIIRHRKESFVFKTLHSASLANKLISVIQTCIEAGKNPLHYLTQLQKYATRVAQQPHLWLPWNYEASLAGG